VTGVQTCALPIFIALHPDGLPRVFSEQHPVSDLDVERHELAFVGPLSLADRRDLALVGLLGRGVRDDDSGRGLLLLVKTLDDYPIVQRTDFHDAAPILWKVELETS